MLDLTWIPLKTSGGLAVGPRPRGGDWLPDEIANWQHAGVQRVVSLLTPEEEVELELVEESQLLAERGIRFQSLPCPDRGVPPHLVEFAGVVQCAAVAVLGGQRVFAHCRQGIGRAGVFGVAVLLELGVPLAESVALVSKSRRRPVPETPEQMAWLARFAQQWPSSFAPRDRPPA